MNEIVQIIEEVGAIDHFLPPYSPDLMPIELAFSKVTTSLKMDPIEKWHIGKWTIILAIY